jgi:hypothetical protein
MRGHDRTEQSRDVVAADGGAREHHLPPRLIPRSSGKVMPHNARCALVLKLWKFHAPAR